MGETNMRFLKTTSFNFKDENSLAIIEPPVSAYDLSWE
jgi:hypothetical protein